MATNDQPLSSALINSLTTSFSGLLKQVPVVGKMFGSLTSMTQILDQNAQTWQALSASGATFENNILQMASSAANARLTLSELTKVVQDNSKIFAGLGGNVSAGSMMFTRASKQFFDETANVATQLRSLGYTNTDLNEILALQLSTYRGSAKKEEQRRADAIISTAKLATEMDLLAKLTGVSRKEQMENMKKAQVDMVAEARIREIAAREGKSIEDVRRVYAEQQSRATLNGTGQMFKEIFAFGTVISKEAGEQQAIIGAEASRAVIEQVRATTKVREADASTFGDKATVALSKMLQTPTFLSLAKIPGEVGDVARALLDANLARDSAITSYIAQNQKSNEAPMSRETAYANLLADAKKVQAQQSSINDAVLQYQQLIPNANATIADGLKSLMESAPLTKILEKITAGISSTNLGMTNLSALYPKLNEHLLKIAEFENSGNLKGQNAEIAAMNKKLATAIEPLDKNIQNAITGVMNSIVDGIQKPPEAKKNESASYSFGKTIHDFFSDARPLSVKISEIPGKIGNAAIHYFVQEALAQMNLPGSQATATLRSDLPHAPTEARATGGRINASDSVALNVQGVPQLLHKEASAGPEWVLNQQQIGLMHANFSQSLTLNRGILSSNQDLARLSMQANSAFLDRISEISSSFKVNQDADEKFKVDFRNVGEQIKSSFNTLDFTNLSNLIKESTISASSITAELSNITGMLTEKNNQSSETTESIPKAYPLTLDRLTELPRVLDVAEKTKAEQTNSEKVKLEKEYHARAAHDAKLLEQLTKKGAEPADTHPKPAAQPDRSAETLTAILLQIERLNTQTRELINQESKNAVNLITATKRSQGYV